MTPQYDHLYLSAHLDDAALSCGGRIFQQRAAGQSVLIVTVTAGDPPLMTALPPFALVQHQKWQLGTDAVALRREEDRQACRTLGATWLHWDVMDCIYRRDPETQEPLYGSEAALFGSVAEVEMARLVPALAERLGAYSAESIYAPLAIGNHVDHQLLRHAAEAAFSPATLRYYEDAPYVFKSAPDRTLGGAWRAETLPLSPPALAAKLDAISCYSSQIGALFGSDAAMRQQVLSYTEQIGGERLWRREERGDSAESPPSDPLL
jgi:LmbE family N-acetylglucosaminyl deacetylase